VKPEEREIAVAVLNRAVKVANKFGPQMIAETDGDIPVTTMAVSLMMGGFCVNAGMSMYESVDILMAAYKQAKEDKEGKQ
jgi:hypothetical protein